MKKCSLVDIFTFLLSLRWMKILNKEKIKEKKKRNNLIDTSWILGLSLSTYRSHFHDVRNGNFKKLFYGLAIRLLDSVTGDKHLCQVAHVLSACLWSWSVMKNGTRKKAENHLHILKDVLKKKKKEKDPSSPGLSAYFLVLPPYNRDL